MTSTRSFKSAIAGVGAAALLAGAAQAGDYGKAVIDDKNPVVPEDPWTLCDIFDLSKIYKDSSNPIIQEVALIGRYHGQYYNVNSNVGDESDYQTRRWRAGLQVKFLNDFKFEGQFNLDDSFDDRFLEDVEDLSVKWTPTDDLYVIVGKVKPKITREYSTSSKNIKTFERSQFVNQIVPDKLGAVQVGYQLTEQLHAEAGIYTGSNSDDWSLPEFNDGIAASLRLTYDLNDATEIRFDYFYAEQGAGSNGVEDYDNIFSLNSSSEWGKLGLDTDLIFATGADAPNHSDGFSIVLLPYYQLTDKLELVGRYTYSTAEGDSGIRLQSRYERTVASDTRGDNYHALYGGLTYRLCGDKLKLMGGVEYSTIGGNADYDGWTLFAGVRMYY